MTNAPPDDPRLAEIRAALARVAERDRTTRPGVIEDYVSYGRSTLDDLQYVADQLDAARTTIAERDAQLAAAREDVQKEKQRADRAVGWLASAYHWTDLIDPENCPADSDVYAEAAKLLNKAREDATLIDALATYLERGLGPDHMIRVWAERKHVGLRVAELGGYRGPEVIGMPKALRAALASLRDRTPETTNG